MPLAQISNNPYERVGPRVSLRLSFGLNAFVCGRYTNASQPHAPSMATAFPAPKHLST